VIPAISYATSGDLQIAYQVVGDGPVDVALAFDWAGNIELMWENPQTERFLRRFASYGRLIFFDIGPPRGPLIPPLMGPPTPPLMGPPGGGGPGVAGLGLFALVRRSAGQGHAQNPRVTLPRYATLESVWLIESPSMGLPRRPTPGEIVEGGRFSRPCGPGALSRAIS
jgi:hypothetical protein